MDMLQVNNREVIIKGGITDKHTHSHKDNLFMVSHKAMVANKVMANKATASLKDMVGKHKVMDTMVQLKLDRFALDCLFFQQLVVMVKTTDNQHKQTTILINNKLEVVLGMDIMRIVQQQQQQQLVVVAMATIKVLLVTTHTQKVNKDTNLILDDNDDLYTTHNRCTSPYNDFEHYNHPINKCFP